MLTGLFLQPGVEYDNAAPDVAFSIRVISPAIAQTASVPDCDSAAVKQIG